MAKKTLPCPRCGNEETIGTFCVDCLRELHPLVKEVKPGKLTLCSTCGNTKLAGIWRHLAQGVAITRALESALIFSPDADIESVEFAEPEPALVIKPGVRKTTWVLAVVTGKSEDATEAYEQEYDTPLQYDVTICPKCSKEGTRYFEGILQIRNERPAVTAIIRQYLRDKREKGLHLAKEMTVGSGSDYYLSDHRAVGHLAKALHSQFGGELKINAQHFSEDAQHGKILYRVNAFLEIPEYSKGDVIERDGRYLYVLGVSKRVKAEDLATGAEAVFAYERGATERLPVRTTRVTSVDPIEVLHPETYQSVRPTNSKFAPAELEIDREVSIALAGESVFLIPDAPERLLSKKVRKRVGQKISKKK